MWQFRFYFAGLIIRLSYHTASVDGKTIDNPLTKEDHIETQHQFAFSYVTKLNDMQVLLKTCFRIKKGYVRISQSLESCSNAG